MDQSPLKGRMSEARIKEIGGGCTSGNRGIGFIVPGRVDLAILNIRGWSAFLRRREDSVGGESWLRSES